MAQSDGEHEVADLHSAPDHAPDIAGAADVADTTGNVADSTDKGEKDFLNHSQIKNCLQIIQEKEIQLDILNKVIFL